MRFLFWPQGDSAGQKRDCPDTVNGSPTELCNITQQIKCHGALHHVLRVVMAAQKQHYCIKQTKRNAVIQCD